MARGKMSKMVKAAKEKEEQMKATEGEPVPVKRQKKKTLQPTIAKNHLQLLGNINEFRKQMEELVQDYESDLLKTPLVLTDGKILPENNKLLYTYEEGLLKVMIGLDGIVNENQVLKDTRKRTIQAVQEKLRVIDEYKHNLDNCNLPPYTPKPKQKRGGKSGSYMSLAIGFGVACASAGALFYYLN
ncbi:hypothetical protein HK103_001282 [Boothiomyces macroporosus]|uniref:BAG domain-containing protein n=1 Tax=Boothiomyces macroporosus TaxID=261099 RepID=A0AAD5Y109_9FUNG|nr:hypothetical protein HK103_001282 [Boothiomyces macroporosus]